MPEEDSANWPQAQAAQRISSRFLSVPSPIKRIFDKFPLITYPPNELPIRSRAHPDIHRLYIFTAPRDSRHGRPSYNPQCLKWQVSWASIFSMGPFSVLNMCRLSSRPTSNFSVYNSAPFLRITTRPQRVRFHISFPRPHRL